MLQLLHLGALLQPCKPPHSVRLLLVWTALADRRTALGIARSVVKRSQTASQTEDEIADGGAHTTATFTPVISCRWRVTDPSESSIT